MATSHRAGSCWGALGRALTQLGPRRGSPKTTKSTLLELRVCDSDLRETAHPQAVGLRRMSEHPVGWGSRAAAWVSRSHLKAGRQIPMASPPRLASPPAPVSIFSLNLARVGFSHLQTQAKARVDEEGGD